MASKKTGKKKARKKGRTAAQKAATAKLVALNKGKKTGKKKSKKRKGSKKKSSKKRASKKGGWRQHSVGKKPAAQYHSNRGGPYNPHKRYKPSVGEQFAGEKGGARFHGPMTPAQELAQANRTIARLSGGHTRKKHTKRHSKKASHKHSGKHSGVVTAASILRGAKSNAMKVYVCAGKRFSGCGGGKKGSHVVGHLRA